MNRLVVIALLAVVAAQPLAWAQSGLRASGWAECLKSDPEVVIPGCTAALKAHKLTPDETPVAFYIRGNAYYAKGVFDRAIEDYNQTIGRSPEFARAYNNRGSAYVALRDYERAILDFTEAARRKVVSAVGHIELAPFDPATAVQNRGVAYLHLSDYGHAIQDFTEAIRLSPNDPEALYKRGMAYNTMGDYFSAIADYNKSIELNPKNAYALYSRGIAKRNSDDADGAQADLEAARHMDPEIAGKISTMTIPVTPIAAIAARDASQSQSVPSCAVLGRSTALAPLPSYVDEPLEHLKRKVPGLRGIQLEAVQSAPGGQTAAPAQERTAFILAQTGALIADLLHRMPNLIAKEEVRQPIGPAFAAGMLADQLEQSDATRDHTSAARYRSHVFSYRIVPGLDPAGHKILHEFRTDAHDRPVDAEGAGAGTPQSVGFATSWLFFFPGNLHESRFRYLGRQKIGNRETYVVAFAQNPEHKSLDITVDSDYGLCSTPNEGVAWIDQSTFRILRMQTDLLSPLPNIQLNRLRAVLNYGPVKIKERNLLLWLPTDVKTSWQTAEGAGDEFHLYSHYRLFGSTIRIVPETESP